MEKIIAFVLFIHCIAISASAQKTKLHKIVFEITSADTADQTTVLRQMNNVIRDAPGTALELVCHGPAIFMLVKDKSASAAVIEDLKTKNNVSFAACANSMRKNNISKEQLLSASTVVPNGVMEVVAKEEDGWSYIKAGH